MAYSRRFLLFAFLVVCPARAFAQRAKSDDVIPLQAHARFGVALFRPGDAVRSMAISPDGTRLATTGFDSIVLFDAKSGRLLKRLLYSQPVAVAFTKDGKSLLVAGSGEDGVRRLDLTTEESTPLFSNPVYARRAAFSLDGDKLATVDPDKGDVQLWDIASAKRGRGISVVGEVLHLAWSHDGAALGITVHHKIPMPKDEFFVVDVATGKERFRNEAAKPGVKVFAFSTNRIALAERWDDIHLLDAKTGETLHRLKGRPHYYSDLTFSPDGRRLLVSAVDGMLDLWDAKKGTLLKRFRAHPHSPSLLTFTPDGDRFYTAGSDGIVRPWNAVTCEPLDDPAAPRGAVQRFCLTPDGSTLVALYEDRIPRVWDVARPQTIDVPTKDLLFSKPFAFSRDGKRLLWGKDGKLFLSDWRAGKQLVQFGVERTHVGRFLYGAAFGKDDKTVIAAGSDSEILIFDANKDKLLRSFKEVHGSISALSVSPAGDLVVFGEGTGTVALVVTKN